MEHIGRTDDLQHFWPKGGNQGWVINRDVVHCDHIWFSVWDIPLAKHLYPGQDVKDQPEEGFQGRPGQAITVRNAVSFRHEGYL
jgi:hypothetical protein